jgi:hypothetical protein
MTVDELLRKLLTLPADKNVYVIGLKICKVSEEDDRIVVYLEN